ncbi:MAG: helix-turn-helix transcriptional regulator [Spirochaetaceae bacterium]|nr:helix-turn-helix transcriptional regulator [Spirochaetaceae bacterium]
MNELELANILSRNIKKYRGNIMTQEALAEKAELSVQLINAIEGGRKWVSKSSLARIASALGVEVYQLFVPQDKTPIVIEDTPENERIRMQMTDEIVEEIRHGVNKALDRIKKESR